MCIDVNHNMTHLEESSKPSGTFGAAIMKVGNYRLSVKEMAFCTAFQNDFLISSCFILFNIFKIEIYFSFLIYNCLFQN